MTTYDRAARPETAPKVRCDPCSPFDDDGFTVDLPDDIGARVWVPRWSVDPTPCVACGADANRHVPWDVLTA